MIQGCGNIARMCLLRWPGFKVSRWELVSDYSDDGRRIEGALKGIKFYMCPRTLTWLQYYGNETVVGLEQPQSPFVVAGLGIGPKSRCRDSWG